MHSQICCSFSHAGWNTNPAVWISGPIRLVNDSAMCHLGLLSRRGSMKRFFTFCLIFLNDGQAVYYTHLSLSISVFVLVFSDQSFHLIHTYSCTCIYYTHFSSHLTHNIHDEFCPWSSFYVAFHTFVLSRSTNDVGLLVYGLFSFPVYWLAASLWFAWRLSEVLSNWYNGNKSGVGNFINSKQWKMRPSALHHKKTFLNWWKAGAVCR